MRILTGLLLCIIFSLPHSAARAASSCAEAARALVAGARADVESSHARSGSGGTLNWVSAEGHEGICRYDNQGRLQSVEITRFPAVGMQPYTVQCSSANYQRRECDLQGHAEDARLERQFSRAQCIRNQTWGIFGSTLWVDRGCNGRFVITPQERWEPYLVKCESVRDRRTECAVRGQARVTLQRKISRASCIEGQTWGHSGEQLWVDRGCRAEFRVGPVTSGDSGYIDVRGRASDACISLARTHGFDVSDYTVLDLDRQHAEVELAAYRRGISMSLLCRYDVNANEARLYGN